MKMKKMLSAALAGAMALSLSVPAFATETEVTMDGLAEGATVEVSGTTQTASVKILVPSAGAVILNPYELDYKATETATAVNDQIISATQYVVNESNLPVKVTTKVTGTIEGADFSATTAAAETTKKVNLMFGIGATSAKDTEPGSFETKALAKTETTFTDITMDKQGGANPAVGYKFSGDASKNPDTPWTADDTIGATIAFTFKLEGGTSSTPAPTPSVTATITEAAGKTSIATSETASLTVALSDNTKSIDSVAWSADDSGANVSLGGSTNATETVSWVAAGGSVTITATVTYDTNKTATATFTLGTT